MKLNWSIVIVDYWIGKNLCAFYTVFGVIFETFHNPSFSILLPLLPPHHKKSKQTKKIQRDCGNSRQSSQ